MKLKPKKGKNIKRKFLLNLNYLSLAFFTNLKFDNQQLFIIIFLLNLHPFFSVQKGIEILLKSLYEIHIELL